MNIQKRMTGNQRGSVLMTVMLVMLILSIIAIGTIQASSNNIIQAKKIDNYERLYYGAESATNSATDFLRKQITSYYGLLSETALSDINGGNTSLTHYYQYKGLFASNILTNCEVFQEPDLTEYEYGNIDTETTFSCDNDENLPSYYNGDGDPVYIFIITSVATEGKDTSHEVSRTFETQVEIVLKDIILEKEKSQPPDLNDIALAVGGELSIQTISTTLEVLGNARIGTESIFPGFFGIGASNFIADNYGSHLDEQNPPYHIVDFLDWQLNFSAMRAGVLEKLGNIQQPSYSNISRPTDSSTHSLSGGFLSLTRTLNLKSSDNGDKVVAHADEGKNLEVKTNATITINPVVLTSRAGDIIGIPVGGNMSVGNTSGNKILTIKNGTLWSEEDMTITSRTSLGTNDLDSLIRLYSGGSISIEGSSNVARNINMYASDGISSSAIIYNPPTSSFIIYSDGSLSLNNSGNIVNNTQIRSGGGTTTLNGTRYENCTIYANGNLELNGTYNNCAIYSTGSMRMNGHYNNCRIYMGSGTIRYSSISDSTDFTDCKILCGGTLTINSGSNNTNRATFNNCRVFSDGRINFDPNTNNNRVTVVEDTSFICSNDLSLSVFSNNSAFVSTGNLKLDRTVAVGCLIYSGAGGVTISNSFSLSDVASYIMNLFGLPRVIEYTTSGVIYTRGSVMVQLDFTDTSFEFSAGQVLAKGNMSFIMVGAWLHHKITGDDDIKDDILEDASLDFLNNMGIIPAESDDYIALLPDVPINETTGEKIN